ncbi:MAG: HEAT repeat domain-containing protein [Planctomycetes bacterium]|nr:HEAT repeat domain-containing protein [Planctomycetota bacterium]
MSACDALGRLGVEQAVPRLRKLLARWDPYQRAGAAEGLASLGDRGAIPRIQRLLDDPAPFVRGTAMLALAALRAYGAVPKIAGFLEDLEISPRLDAARALSILRAVEWAPRIAPLLGEKDALSQNIALSALRALRVPTGQARIVELIEGGCLLVVGPAMAAAGHIGIRAAVPAIRRRLEDPDREIRVRAALALIELGEDAGVPVLLETGKQLNFLNALRSPGVWEKLDALPLRASVEATRREHLARIGVDAGLRIEAGKVVSRRLDSHVVWYGVQENPSSLLDLLRAVLPRGVAFLLEPEAIRILPVIRAWDVWSLWWKQRCANAGAPEVGR